MTSITLHDLDDVVAARLRVRAAKHGRTVEQEACAVLRDALGSGDAPPEPPPEKLGTAMQELFKPFGDVVLPIPPREPPRDPPTFD
ncbi:MAG: plasmid stabilization protein [Chloroflexi bacterium]|nr:plasmid stabilization protein [Chloroflexota bacterium]